MGFRIFFCLNILSMSTVCVTVAAMKDVHLDPPSESFPRENYAVIFKNIPKLFGHVMDLLEDHPQILERNDQVFKRAAGDERASSCKESHLSQDVADYIKRILHPGGS